MKTNVNIPVYALLVSSVLSLSACKEQQTTGAKQQAEQEKSIISLSQQDIDNLANSLDVKYHFLSNIETDCPDKDNKPVAHCYSAEILLTNNTNADVFADDKSWQLNYSQVYPAYASESDDFNLLHLNGDIHQITAKDSFAGFKAGQTHKVKLWVKSTLIGEPELMPNYWLAANNLQARVIASTQTSLDSETGLEVQPYVVPFNDTVKQIKSAPNDINEYSSPAWLYDNAVKIEASITQQQLASAIIPTPQSVKLIKQDAYLDISNGLAFSFVGNIKQNDIDAAIERLSLLGVHSVGSGDKRDAAIPVTITLNEAKPTNWRAGHYQLSVTERGIDIIAQDKAGAFYALQSVASLVQLGSTTLPLVEVTDQPHYDYRGQHVDVARNFHSKEFIFALIKQMAAYKLNKLHLHLAEDEGWRLQLPSFPELTQISSKRCMELNDKACLQPQLGGAGASDRDGFYSVEDYQEILTLAKAHYIQVIPSLDMPGHSRAAIKAMEARYHAFMKQENELEAKRYLLTDFDDKTKYSSIQNYNDNTLNICMESTYAFVDRVLEDLKAMHEQAGHPLNIYHIGADETAGAWLESPICQALVADKTNEVNNIKHLSAHFIERVSNMVASKGIGVAGWNDGLKETDVTRMPSQVYSYIWDTLPWGAHIQVSEQAHRNWQVILSTPDAFYYDLPYQVDPKERGYHWAARRVNTRSIYNFMPDNLPIHAEFRLDTLGQHFVSDDTKQVDEQGKLVHQPLPKNFSVYGVQGQLWSETIRSEKQAEYMIYPRLLALAERAWHKASWQVPYNEKGQRFDKASGVFTEELSKQRDQQWSLFSQVIAQKELAKLDKAGIFYRIPSPGAKIIAGKLHANITFNGLPIEYKDSSGVWQAYQQGVAVQTPIMLRARSADGQRAGRSLTIAN